MPKIEKPVDEDPELDPGEAQFDLEYRLQGEKRWWCSHGGPLDVRGGKPTKISIRREKKLTLEDLSVYGEDGVIKFKEPKVEWRIVKKEFVVKRSLVSERSL